MLPKIGPTARTFAEAGVLAERDRLISFCAEPMSHLGTLERGIVEHRLCKVAEAMRTAPLPVPELTANEAVRAEQTRWQALLRDIYPFQAGMDEPGVQTAVDTLYEFASNMDHLNGIRH